MKEREEEILLCKISSSLSFSLYYERLPERSEGSHFGLRNSLIPNE